MKTKQPRHTITISKDGWVSLETDIRSDYQKVEGIEAKKVKGLGDIGVDVEIVDERPATAQHTCSHIKCTNPHCMYDDDKKIKKTTTYLRTKTQPPSHEDVEKAVAQSIIDDHVTLERARIIEEVEKMSKKQVQVRASLEKINNMWDYVPKDDGMYCQTCERFLPEEGCLCGMVNTEDIINIIKEKKHENKTLD